MEKILLLSVFLNIILLYKRLIQSCLLLSKKCRAFLKFILIYVGFYSNSSDIIKKIPRIYYAKESEIQYLTETQHLSGKPLPDTFIIRPDHYIYANKQYDLSREGIYRLMFPAKIQNSQRIVYEKDVSALMSSLAWTITHGSRDDHLTFSQLVLRAQSKKLILTCEASARFAFALLKSLNLSSRVIGARTFDTWSGYDDGHYLIEVYRPDIQKWVIYDLDHDVFFMKNNHPLSLIEWMTYLPTDDYEMHFLSNDIKSSLNDITQYDFSFIDEGRINNLKQWYKHIMQFVFIENEEGNYSYLSLDETVLKNYPKGSFPKSHALPKKTFIEKFYEEAVI